MPDLLPIHDIRPALRAAAARSRRLVITAPTGSGKSTQIPQYLLDDGLADGGQVVVIQPRRLAARMLAARVARERGCELGGEVGYRVRFESRASASTRILYETEGILLRRLLDDPSLRGVGAVVLDEFHERHVHGDVTLAQALLLQRSRRPDLLIAVMSATLDTARLEPYLAPCELLRSEGRTYPVDITYLPPLRPSAPPRPPVWDLAAQALEDDARRHGGLDGDVLVFMPGAHEIHRTIDALRRTAAARGAAILPLHGELPPADQDAAVAPSSGPKIVVATNVAETSLTIPGIRLVIDSGYARTARFDPWRGINTLMVEPISRASADQRAGRAGRTAPGRCIRLWSEREHDGRAPADLPEILRIDPSEILLTLKAQGIDDLSAFPWLDPPAEKAADRALQLLRDLGALDAAGAITPLGRRMLAFPLHPRHSRMMLAAAGEGAVRPVALLAALAQGRPILERRADRDRAEARDDLLGDATASDDRLLLRAFSYAEKHRFDPVPCRRLGIHAAAARQAAPLRDRFIAIARAQGLPVESAPPEDDALARCILAGFSDQVARRLDRGTLRCELVRGRRGDLARESAARDAPLLVATEIREIGQLDGASRVLLTQATAIREEWLREMYPADFLDGQLTVRWDPAAKRVTAAKETLFRGLAFGSRPAEPPPDDAARILADTVLRGETTLKNWNRDADRWIARANALAAAWPEWAIPPYDEDARRTILEQICHGALSAKDVKDRPVLPALRSWLSPAQQAMVEKHMPERITLPNGRNVKIQYTDGAPHIAARIQELFGVQALPPIASGRIPLAVHILAPSQRPVQITSDLPAFWRDHYPRIRQELRRKYPKHAWPEIP